MTLTPGTYTCEELASGGVWCVERITEAGNTTFDYVMYAIGAVALLFICMELCVISDKVYKILEEWSMGDDE